MGLGKVVVIVNDLLEWDVLAIDIVGSVGKKVVGMRWDEGLTVLFCVYWNVVVGIFVVVVSDELVHSFVGYIGMFGFSF